MEKRFSSPSVICHSFVLDADVELIEFPARVTTTRVWQVQMPVLSPRQRRGIEKSSSEKRHWEVLLGE
ncbi:hypothetical protein GIB67_030527 [Kingdonia uniflora]|uniref:Uncharacterized protein n=1 Tax=Kingdonia uniflora TaxID=39325 RepID=A0A7J7M9R4_9MAGN|nr:hypothetical protein GIB67_030527 [Kingdonia uniflora]